MFHDEPLHSALGAPRLAFPGAAPVEEMPIRDFLAASAYYPAAGTDLWPVLALADVCSTFVFADYCVSAEDAVAALERLHPSSIRDVTSRALLPGRRWVPGRRKGLDKGFPYAAPFALLARFRVRGGREERWAGEVRFRFPGSWEALDREVELLYIGGAGVATYEALYHGNGVAPKLLAILRPGIGFGFNWTDFRATGEALEAFRGYGPGRAS